GRPAEDGWDGRSRYGYGSGCRSWCRENVRDAFGRFYHHVVLYDPGGGQDRIDERGKTTIWCLHCMANRTLGSLHGRFGQWRRSDVWLRDGARGRPAGRLAAEEQMPIVIRRRRTEIGRASCRER